AELLEEVCVEIDLLVGGAVERAGLRARGAAAGDRRAGEQDEDRALVLLARPLEGVGPQVVGVVGDRAHELDHVAVVGQVHGRSRLDAGLPAEAVEAAPGRAAAEELEGDKDHHDDEHAAPAQAFSYRYRDPAATPEEAHAE